jgi:hypothetical protein
MPENQHPGVPPEFENAAEHALWTALGKVEAAEPSPRLRQSFYRRLEQASRRTWHEKLRDTLGFRGNAGWLTAMACLLAGLGIGQLTGGGDDAGARLAALEQNVTMLNRRLILDRLESDTPGKRLRGVLDAAYVAGDDAEIAHALLARATGDRVPSVRSAAIDALGSRIDAPAVGRQVMDLLRQADSPIVQFALVDLVLRYGNDEQIGQLLTLADDGRLHPDLKRHVFTALKRDTT